MIIRTLHIFEDQGKPRDVFVIDSFNDFTPNVFSELAIDGGSNRT